MNSSITSLDLRTTAYWQSSPERVDAMSVVGNRAPRRVGRRWQQRVGVAIGVLMLQIAFGVALIKGGYVDAVKLPDHLTVVDIKSNDLVVEMPPPKMPEILVPIVPIDVPVTIEVAADNAITLPPPRPQTAPVRPGAGASDGTAIVKGYQMALLRHLSGHKRYPVAARTRRHQGVVMVRFTMDRRGQVLSSSMATSSRFESLDQEGVELVRRASPLPAPPPELPGDPISLIVPVEFYLH